MSRTYTSNPHNPILTSPIRIIFVTTTMRSTLISACLIGASFLHHVFLLALVESAWKSGLVLFFKKPLSKAGPPPPVPSVLQNQRQKQAMTKTTWYVLLLFSFKNTSSKST